MPRVISDKGLKGKAWALHSQVVRRKAKGVCYTCGDRRPWKEQQAGHFIHKDCLDHERRNIHCQCVKCNKWLHGNLGEYANRLIQEYGRNIVDTLTYLGNKTHKFNRDELFDLISKYEKELAELDDF